MTRTLREGSALRRGLGCAALGVALGLAGAPASAEGAVDDAAAAAARARVADTVERVLAVLRDPALSGDDKRARIEGLAYERFDFATISRLVLARNWRRMTPEQRAAFQEEFKRHLSLTYGGSVDRYRDEEVVLGATRVERNGDVTVRTRVEGDAAEPVFVDYRLRRREDAWLVIDVIIENVSLLQNFRTQTQELISNVGPEGLIEKLRSKNEARTAKGG